MREKIEKLTLRVIDNLTQIKNNFGNNEFTKDHASNAFVDIVFALEDMAEFFDLDLLDEIDKINHILDNIEFNYRGFKMFKTVGCDISRGEGYKFIAGTAHSIRSRSGRL